MDVDINRLRLSLVDAYNELSATLQDGLSEQTVTVDAGDIDEAMRRLGAGLAAIACTSIDGDDSMRDLSDEIEIEYFEYDD